MRVRDLNRSALPSSAPTGDACREAAFDIDPGRPAHPPIDIALRLIDAVGVTQEEHVIGFRHRLHFRTNGASGSLAAEQGRFVPVGWNPMQLRAPPSTVIGQNRTVAPMTVASTPAPTPAAGRRAAASDHHQDADELRPDSGVSSGHRLPQAVQQENLKRSLVNVWALNFNISAIVR